MDLGSYRAGHTAETAQFLVVSGVTCGLQCLLHQHGGDIRGETDLAPGLKVEVEDTIDHDSHLVVPVPVPHDVGPDIVPHTAVYSLDGGEEVGGEDDTEGEAM